jgi:hypothetical protein
MQRAFDDLIDPWTAGIGTLDLQRGGNQILGGAATPTPIFGVRLGCTKKDRLATSHKITRLSALPQARSLPSGLKATLTPELEAETEARMLLDRHAPPHLRQLLHYVERSQPKRLVVVVDSSAHLSDAHQVQNVSEKGVIKR